MNIDQEQLTRDINDANKDVEGLRKEIESLELELLAADKSVTLLEKQIQQEKVKTTALANDKTHNEKRRKRHIDELDPPIVQHRYFDDSISQYFDTSSDAFTKYRPQPEINISEVLLEVSQRSRLIVGLKENILYENIFRFSGITAFPLKDEFTKDDEYLGIRFDNYSMYTKKFLDPHYVILRKEEIDNKQKGLIKVWKVYRDTLPSYIPTEEIGEYLTTYQGDKGLKLFVSTIRKQLVKTQFKHDLFSQLYQLKFKDIGDNTINSELFVTKHINKDLLCLLVVIQLETTSARPLELHLRCSDNIIENAEFSATEHQQIYKKAFMGLEAQLRGCKLQDMKSKLQTSLKSLLLEGIL